MKITEIDKLKALLVIVLGLSILFLVFKLPLLLYIAIGIGVISLMIPIVGDGIVWAWFKLAEVLGWINSKILLSVLFFVFLTPLAWLARMRKNRPIQLKQSEKTMYVERNHQFTKDDLENTW